MQHIKPDAMSKPIRKLWEISRVKGLSPYDLAPVVGVHFSTIYRWFGGQEPLPAHGALIIQAIEKLEPTLPEMEQGPDGLEWAASATWGAPPDPEAARADRELNAELAKVFVALMAKAEVGGERDILMKAWAHFGEIVAAMRRHGVKFEI